MKSPQQDGEAGALLQTVLGTNAQLGAIKGIGFVKLKQDNRLDSFRAAWIGSRPDKFRLEILAATGQPVMSFASDGKCHYLLSYADNRLYQRKASEKGLKRLIPIGITPGEILALLSGRLPVHPGSRAQIVRRGDDDTLVLTLEDPDGGNRDTLFASTNEGAGFYRMDRYDRRGMLTFRAVFDKIREDEGLRIPEALTITNDEGAMIQLTVERSWVNPAVSEDKFVLKSPDR